MTFGNSKEALLERSVLHEGDHEISERAFNLIIGGVLLWGFLLNWLTVRYFSYDVMRFVWRNGPGLIYIGYLVSALVGVLLVSLPNAVVSFIGYNMIAVPVGILLCIAIDGIEPVVVSQAVQFTGIITVIFMGLGTFFPDFFRSMGRALLTGLGILIVGELVTGLFFGSSVAWSWFGAGLFALYIAYDWARCTVCACTVDNAVDAASNLYLDIINLFLRILSILSRSRSRD